MNKREVAEDIIRQGGDCRGIRCISCPFEDDVCISDEIDLKKAIKYLKENHMTKTERIEEMERQLKALKAEVVEDAKPSHPYVGEGTRLKGRTVLFTEIGTGIELSSVNGGFGETRSSWNMGAFKPFTGTIEYKNGKPV